MTPTGHMQDEPVKDLGCPQTHTNPNRPTSCRSIRDLIQMRPFKPQFWLSNFKWKDLFIEAHLSLAFQQKWKAEEEDSSQDALVSSSFSLVRAAESFCKACEVPRHSAARDARRNELHMTPCDLYTPKAVDQRPWKNETRKMNYLILVSFSSSSPMRSSDRKKAKRMWPSY